MIYIYIAPKQGWGVKWESIMIVSYCRLIYLLSVGKGPKTCHRQTIRGNIIRIYEEIIIKVPKWVARLPGRITLTISTVNPGIATISWTSETILNNVALKKLFGIIDNQVHVWYMYGTHNLLEFRHICTLHGVYFTTPVALARDEFVIIPSGCLYIQIYQQRKMELNGVGSVRRRHISFMTR